jgi:hypothetical protein
LRFKIQRSKEIPALGQLKGNFIIPKDTICCFPGELVLVLKLTILQENFRNKVLVALSIICFIGILSAKRERVYAAAAPIITKGSLVNINSKSRPAAPVVYAELDLFCFG